MADMENSRSIELYDEPIKTVSYINYDDFFNDKFTTQIRINDTNEYITKNYAAMFDGTDSENNLLYTKCVAASKTDIAKAYYNEKKKYYENKDKYYTCTSDYCKAANFDEGFYVLDNYGNNDFELIFIRGNEVFDVNITQTNINDEKFIKAIKDIKQKKAKSKGSWLFLFRLLKYLLSSCGKLGGNLCFLFAYDIIFEHRED